MAETAVPYGRKTQRAPAVKEVHVLWITAGLGCDGDSVSITAATQPSIEDVLLGAIPGLPKVHLHNPVLAYESGDEFMKYWYQAEEGRLDPFVLVVEGSIPNEKIKNEGYWAALGTDRRDRPADPDLRLDRPAGAQGAGGRGDRHLRDLRRHPRHGGKPHRLHGPGRLSRLGLEIEGRPADRQRARLPGAARQLHGDAALPALPGRRAGADDPAGRPAAADVAVRQDGPRRLRPGRLLRAGRFRRRVRLAQVHRQARLLGPGGQLQRPQAGLDGRHRRLPQRRRHLHRLHHARLPRQVHAVHGRAARRTAVVDGDRPLRPRDPRAPRVHPRHRQQGTEVASHGHRADHRLSSRAPGTNRKESMAHGDRHDE